MLFLVEAQVALDVAVDQRAGGDHLRVQPRVAADVAVEHAAVAVGPVHHRGNANPATGHNAGFLSFPLWGVDILDHLIYHCI